MEVTEGHASPISDLNQWLYAMNSYETLYLSLYICLHRYANNVPLINADDDALSCSLFTSLRRAPAWSRHALQLRMDADQPPALSRPSVTHISSGRGDAGSLSVFKNSPMSLRFQMDDTSAVPDAFRVKCIVLIVNVRMRNGESNSTYLFSSAYCIICCVYKYALFSPLYNHAKNVGGSML
jgi:hypothetical protein